MCKKAILSLVFEIWSLHTVLFLCSGVVSVKIISDKKNEGTWEPTCGTKVTELPVLLIYCHLFCAEWSEIMASTQSPHQQPYTFERVRMHGSQYFQSQKVVNRALPGFVSWKILSTAFRNLARSILSQSKRMSNVSVKVDLLWQRSKQSRSVSRKAGLFYYGIILSSPVSLQVQKSYSYKIRYYR